MESHQGSALLHQTIQLQRFCRGASFEDAWGFFCGGHNEILFWAKCKQYPNKLQMWHVDTKLSYYRYIWTYIIWYHIKSRVYFRTCMRHAALGVQREFIDTICRCPMKCMKCMTTVTWWPWHDFRKTNYFGSCLLRLTSSFRSGQPEFEQKLYCDADPEQYSSIPVFPNQWNLNKEYGFYDILWYFMIFYDASLHLDLAVKLGRGPSQNSSVSRVPPPS